MNSAALNPGTAASDKSARVSREATRKRVGNSFMVNSSGGGQWLWDERRGRTGLVDAHAVRGAADHDVHREPDENPGVRTDLERPADPHLDLRAGRVPRRGEADVARALHL